MWYSHRMVKFYTLKSNRGLEVTFTNLGASIYLIKFYDKIMTLTPSTIKDFKRKNIYHGKTIGPIANRVDHGSLIIEGKEYKYDINEGDNSLHSGKKGISNKVFDTELKDKEIIFTLKDKDVTYKVSYELKGYSLYVTHEVKVNKDMPISLTNHAYFCLGDSNLDNLSLTIPSSRFIYSRKEDLIPLEERKIVPCLDFNKAKKIMDEIDTPFLVDHTTKGYDHCLLLDKGDIVLANEKYQLNVSTTYPAVHIYSDNYDDHISFMTSKQKIRKGLAIEPEDNLLNRPLIHKGETYLRKISYKFVKLK